MTVHCRPAAWGAEVRGDVWQGNVDDRCIDESQGRPEYRREEHPSAGGLSVANEALRSLADGPGSRHGKPAQVTEATWLHTCILGPHREAARPFIHEKAA